jgi:Protein of unknown function (DUF2846)
MLNSRRLFACSVLAGVAVLAGCASVQTAPPQADEEAKRFTAKPGMAQIYVYRNEVLGAAVSMPVTLNGKLAGQTGSKSFFKFDVPAGSHMLTSQGEASKLEVKAEAGKRYFVWQEVKMGGFSGGSKLQLVSEEVGRKGVLESKLIQAQF